MPGIDIEWALEHLATKDDIKRVEETLNTQRTATHQLRDTLNIDIGKKLLEHENRLRGLETFKQEHHEERRETTRREEDRRKQRVTWSFMLIMPVLAVLGLAWNGLVAVLRALHILGR